MTQEMNSVEAAYFKSLLDLFSVVFVLDRDLNVVFASETLLRHVPRLDEKPLVTEVLELTRPRSLDTYEDIVARVGSLFLLTALDQSFAMRGQFIHGTENERDYLVFCGAPWLHWMNTNKPDVKLGLKDFSAQDVQLDQLLYMATESNMVADLERLNSELLQAKEELEKAQTARNAFFAQMSHELRTPLNGVVSALALMKEEKLQGRAEEMLALAQKSSRNMLQVINYVLDIAKLESLQTEVNQIDFDLSQLVDSVIDIVRPRALEKNLDLRVRSNAVLAPVYRGDATALRQVMLNLMVNAIKFTDEGSVSVDIDGGRSEGMSVRIEVSDTGVGIPVDAQSRIFEPFSTSMRDGSPEALGESTGLGLDIARRSVESMGGTIGLISAPGGGSRFWIELPLQSVATSVQGDESELTEVSDASFAGHVLLVDDNETNLTLTTMILEAMGVDVTPASSGEEAVERAINGHYALVLMDISMPGIDGYEATRRIREVRKTSALPIIALSAFTGAEEQRRSREAGMNGYLTKPLEPGPLSEVLSTYLKCEEPDESAESSAPVSADPLVDMTVLRQLESQIGIQNLVTVIDKFADEATRRWGSLEQASSNVDVAREAHTLASTCRSFGLPQVADELSAIESSAKNDSFSHGSVNMPALANRLSEQVAELTATVSAMANQA